MSFKYSSCFVCGLLVAFSFPTFFLVPLILIGYFFFLKQLYLSSSNSVNFKCGLAFGLGFFLISLHWIIFPLRLDQNYENISFFLAFLFIFLLSFFYAFLGLVLGIFIKKSKKNPMLFFDSFVIALIIFLFELLRSHLFGGFPWNLTAHIWGFDIRMFNIVKSLGVEILSFITIYWIIIFSKLLFVKKKTLSILFLLGLPSVLYLHSKMNFDNDKNIKHLNVRIIQPNIAQKIKWDKDYYFKNLKVLTELTNSKSSFEEKIDLIIWPESAVPFLIEDKENNINFFEKNFDEDQNLFLGAIRKSQINGSQFFNSFFYIRNGKIVSFYDKTKLVPFGEFMPFRNLIPFKKITEGSTDFSKGTTQKIINFFDLRGNEIIVKPSICYEGIFFQKTTAEQFPNIIINITNDAWFGNTIGPGQHLTATRFRALELGLPLVRVANTGISGVFDSNGKNLEVISLNKRGIIDTKLFYRTQMNSKKSSKFFLILFFTLIFGVSVIYFDFLKKNS